MPWFFNTNLLPATITDLSISLAGNPATMLTGSNLAYTITVKNHGRLPAFDVMVSDLLPAGCTFRCHQLQPGVHGCRGDDRV